MTAGSAAARHAWRALLACGVALMAAPAAGQDATGVYQRENGASRVRIERCGSALCGTIVWLKDEKGPAKLGQRVFYDMVPSGTNQWSGQAFNPEDGKTYAGKMTLAGKRLTTSGCVLGGMICRSVNWSRM